jgi:hypothetical protein
MKAQRRSDHGSSEADPAAAEAGRLRPVVIG